MTAELEPNEPHPMAQSAMNYVAKYIGANPNLIEAIASTALSGNRTAEICMATLQRLLESKPVSDRYVLGLAWYLREIEELRESLPSKSKRKVNKELRSAAKC